jgi:hypothetical protein
MAIYTPEKTPYANGLDEIGIYMGLPRIESETLANYQRRLILEARDPSGATQDKFVRSLGRRVGLFCEPMFEVSLTLDGNGLPLAVDPYLEITSGYIRLYDNYATDSLDVGLSFSDRANGYFLRDVYAAINASAFFDIAILDAGYEFKFSRHLRYGNSNKYMYSELLRSSVETKLEHFNIREFSPREPGIFVTEVFDIDLLLNAGEYFIDYYNGVVFTYSLQTGYASYVYRDFPYRLFYEPVHAYPLGDVDKKEFFKSNLISDTTGTSEKVLLTSTGAKIFNDVLDLHPMTWGK